MFPYGPMLEAVLARVPSSEGYLFPGRTENECFWGWSRGKQNFDKLPQVTPNVPALSLQPSRRGQSKFA